MNLIKRIVYLNPSRRTITPNRLLQHDSGAVCAAVQAVPRGASVAALGLPCMMDGFRRNVEARLAGTSAAAVSRMAS